MFQHIFFCCQYSEICWHKCMSKNFSLSRSGQNWCSFSDAFIYSEPQRLGMCVYVSVCVQLCVCAWVCLTMCVCPCLCVSIHECVNEWMCFVLFILIIIPYFFVFLTSSYLRFAFFKYVFYNYFYLEIKILMCVNCMFRSRYVYLLM